MALVGTRGPSSCQTYFFIYILDLYTPFIYCIYCLHMSCTSGSSSVPRICIRLFIYSHLPRPPPPHASLADSLAELAVPRRSSLARGSVAAARRRSRRPPSARHRVLLNSLSTLIRDLPADCVYISPRSTRRRLYTCVVEPRSHLYTAPRSAGWLHPFYAFPIRSSALRAAIRPLTSPTASPPT